MAALTHSMTLSDQIDSGLWQWFSPDSNVKPESWIMNVISSCIIWVFLGLLLLHNWPEADPWLIKKNWFAQCDLVINFTMSKSKVRWEILLDCFSLHLLRQNCGVSTSDYGDAGQKKKESRIFWFNRSGLNLSLLLRTTPFLSFLSPYEYYLLLELYWKFMYLTVHHLKVYSSVYIHKTAASTTVWFQNIFKTL